MHARYNLSARSCRASRRADQRSKGAHGNAINNTVTREKAPCQSRPGFRPHHAGTSPRHPTTLRSWATDRLSGDAVAARNDRPRRCWGCTAPRHRSGGGTATKAASPEPSDASEPGSGTDGGGPLVQPGKPGGHMQRLSLQSKAALCVSSVSCAVAATLLTTRVPIRESDPLFEPTASGARIDASKSRPLPTPHRWR